MVALQLCVVLGAACCAAAPLRSSFWAPLWDPRLLGYRVDAPFDAGAGLSARAAFDAQHGHRAERLVAQLGDGHGPPPPASQVPSDVKFYYTYPGADNIPLPKIKYT